MTFRAIGVLALAASVATLGGCSPGGREGDHTVPPAASSGATRWGFTPFPASLDQAGLERAYAVIESDANLVAHHFDHGIPWEALIEGRELPDTLRGDLGYRRRWDDAHPQWTVYVATSLLDVARRGVAGGWPGEQRPPGMSTFADPRVREGAKAWVRLLVDELRPDYLNASVEMNLYADAAPGDYPNLVSLYREIRAEVKAEHPDLPVFPSFQLEQLDDLEPVREVLDAADLVAISTYPVIRAAPGVPPETRYDDLAGLGRPLAVVETGFPAFPVEGAGTTLDVDPGAQAAYVEWLGRRAATPGLELVVWFFPYDLPADLPVPDEVADVTVVFEHMGLLDTSGRERPALDAWRRARAGADPEGP